MTDIYSGGIEPTLLITAFTYPKGKQQIPASAAANKWKHRKTRNAHQGRQNKKSTGGNAAMAKGSSRLSKINQGEGNARCSVAVACIPTIAVATARGAAIQT